MKYNLGNPYMRSNEVEVKTSTKNNQQIANINDGYNEAKAIERLQKERYITYRKDADTALELARKAQKEPTAREFNEQANKRRMDIVSAQRERGLMYGEDTLLSNRDKMIAEDTLPTQIRNRELTQMRQEERRQRGDDMYRRTKQLANQRREAKHMRREDAMSEFVNDTYFEAQDRRRKPFALGGTDIKDYFDDIPSIPRVRPIIRPIRLHEQIMNSVPEQVVRDTMDSIIERAISGKNYRLNNPVINTVMADRNLANAGLAEDVRKASMNAQKRSASPSGTEVSTEAGDIASMSFRGTHPQSLANLDRSQDPSQILERIARVSQALNNRTTQTTLDNMGNEFKLDVGYLRRKRYLTGDWYNPTWDIEKINLLKK